MKILKNSILITSIFALVFLIFYVGIYIYAKTWPKLDISTANSFYLYDNESHLFTGGNSNDWISLDQISENMINATISVEDKNFYSHKGFDFPRIVKALYINLTNGKTLQGASTISQQYAKNLFLDFDKTWNRKIDEAWLTVRLEAYYSKNEILEGYLNTINYGGIFGIENASHYYFNKSASELSLAEATILAGIPKYPSLYSPLVNEKAAKERQLLILNSMVKNKYITEEEKDEAYNTKLEYYGIEERNNLSTLMYYQDAVIDELKNIDSIPSSFLATGGLKVYTALDIELQKNMEQNMKNDITNENLEIASVAIEPNTGKILALIGGKDYSKSQFNRATNSKRQVGSTMKPILYYAALENGFTSSTKFNSTKTTFVFSENKTYSPQNFGNQYPNKEISLAAALAYSDNIYAVKTNLFLGEDILVDTAKKLGIKSNLEAIPSLALGTEEINIMEMMQAYGAFANNGYKITPHLIERVEDMNGNVLYEYKTQEEQILNKNSVFILNELLTNSYSSDFIDYSYPTCYNIAYKMTHKYAVKTGTTDTDLLIFGYNPDLLIGIWSGYDDNSKVDSKESAGIKNMWIDSMEFYLKDKENTWYEIPDNVVGVLVDPISGEITTNDKKTLLYYLKGTEPYLNELKLEDLLPVDKQE